MNDQAPSTPPPYRPRQQAAEAAPQPGPQGRPTYREPNEAPGSQQAPPQQGGCPPCVNPQGGYGRGGYQQPYQPPQPGYAPHQPYQPQQPGYQPPFPPQQPPFPPQQPPYWQQQPWRPYPAGDNGSNVFGIIGFIVAILSLFVGWVPLVGWFIWLAGAVLSFIGLFHRPRGLAIAGVIISLVLIPMVVSILVAVDAFTSAMFLM